LVEPRKPDSFAIVGEAVLVFLVGWAATMMG
jgi:hypothetical protein